MENKKNDRMTEAIIKWLSSEKPANVTINEMNLADDEGFHPVNTLNKKSEDEKKQEEDGSLT